MKVSNALAALAFASMAAGAAAQDQSILGLPFGSTLDRELPECPRLASGATRTDYCSDFGPLKLGVAGKLVFLQRPVAGELRIPSWVVTSKPLQVNLDREGVINYMVAWTSGVGRQADVIESVSSRFGAPSSREARQARNAMGATWTVELVQWERPDILVTHDCSAINSCMVRFETPAYREEALKRMRTQKEKDKL